MSAIERFNPLDYRLAFLRPLLLTPASAWVQHIPFAYALIDMCRPNVVVELGTHHGDSYCAFCQAVAELGLPTRCTAIDTWAGDEHTGKYGEHVLPRLREFHDPRYTKFSTLKQSTFDDALRDFADGSIDLLHIDGFHTYDAVKHDFQSWLPKMSKAGVIIMHDTTEKMSDFGVYKLWDEISTRYPHLNFRHGHGLGVLAVGSEPPPALMAFLQLAAQPDAHDDILDFFEHIGWLTDVLRMTSCMVTTLYDLHYMLNRRKELIGEAVQPMTFEQINVSPVKAMRQLWPAMKEVVTSDLRARNIQPGPE